MKFSEFRLDPKVEAGVRSCGYEHPTPIQQQTIPAVMEGRNVMGLAQTGTGKTAAFVLPILHRLLSGPRGQLRTLILAPTRELAQQICDAIQELGHDSRLTATTVYGGVSIRPQIQALRRGVDIVVACPGRLLDHIQQRTINLSKLEILVLDEADMMLDMGFLPDVRRILRHLPTQRQSLMFSATMPDAIRSLSTEILPEAVTVKISHSKPVDTVAHALYPVPQQLKTSLLIELLAKTDTESVLVFTRTKHRAKKLGVQLAKEGHKAASLQGNLSQAARQAALAGFRAGRYNVLVATDIAARGIDVSQVSHVINFDIPDTTDAYTHRIGRTGRALRTGDAFTLISHEDEMTVRAIERVLGSRIERRVMEGFDYNKRVVREERTSDDRPAPFRSERRPASGRSERRSAPERSERRSAPERSDRGPARNAAPARTRSSAPRGPWKSGDDRRQGSPSGDSRRSDSSETNWEQPKWSSTYYRDGGAAQPKPRRGRPQPQRSSR